MNKRSLVWVSFLAAVALLAAAAGIYSGSLRNSADLQGRLVFAKTFDQGAKVDKIVITTAEDVVELIQKDSYWKVAGKGGYYADFQLMHRFLTSINQSIYAVKLPYTVDALKKGYLFNPLEHKEDSGMLIRTYAGDNLLDEIIIGLPDADHRYFFARRPQQEEIWLTDGDFDLPILSEYWLLRPVLSVPEEAVESITIGDKYIQRENRNGDFANEQGLSVNAAPLLEVLSAVTIADAVSEADFTAENPKTEPLKTIDVITFYGLEFVCRLYDTGDGKLWLNVNLSTTPLPMSSVNAYIRDNRFLYDGWYFEISPRQGHILRNFRLI